MRIKTLTAILMVTAVLVPAMAAQAAPTVLDFEVAPGLYNVYPGHPEVIFNNGVEVYACTATTCGTARSGTRAARSEFAGEFAREEFRVSFSSLQSVVSLYVRSDEASGPNIDYSATLKGFSSGGTELYSQTINFQRLSTWQAMSIGNVANTPDIASIRLTGGESGFTTNFLAVDDLSFEGATAPPPPTDTSPPIVNVSRPSASEVRTVHSVVVDVSASDNMSLNHVNGAIERPDGTQIQGLDYCGSTFSGPCPLPNASGVSINPAEQTIVLPSSLPNGEYVVRVEGCDEAANCTTTEKTFVLDVTVVPATRVIPAQMEVNQAVQDVMMGIPPRGSIDTLSTGVPILRGRTTVLRWYFFGEGGVAENFTGRLTISGERTDGTTFGRNLSPNTPATSITVPADPGSADRQKTIRFMRGDPNSSLNFVLPADYMANVRFMDLVLSSGGSRITGHIQFRPQREARLGVNILRATGEGVNNLPMATTEQIDGMLNYVRAAYPVSEVRVLVDRRAAFDSDDFLEFFYGHCGYLIAQLDATWGGDDAPVRSFTDDPNIISNVGVTPVGGIEDSGGCAFVGNPADDSNRYGGVNMNEPFGDILAQEIGHNMGLIHASNSHGEADGGDAEPWPYMHGTIGDDSFGVWPAVVTPPTGGDLGVWNIGLIDPCRSETRDIDEIWPTCTAPDDRQHHDFMSYGGPFTWTSDITYNRLNGAIRHRIPPTRFSYSSMPKIFTEPGEPRVDTLLLSGVLLEDGTNELLMTTRKDLPSTLLTQNEGAMDLQLLDEAGVVLNDVHFDPVELTDHVSHRDVFNVKIPWVPGLAMIRILDAAGETVVEETASANAPVVEITSPNGGEVLASGVHTVTWEGSDADGDELTYLVQYSPDGGWSWQGLDMVMPGDPLEAEIDTSDVIPGRWGVIRVTASDGVNTTQDESDFFLSVGTDEQPGPQTATNVVSLRLRKHLVATGKVASNGPPSCTEGVNVTILRKGKPLKTVPTDELGRYRVSVRDRRGSYQAVTALVERADLACSRASSPTRRHRHR